MRNPLSQKQGNVPSVPGFLKRREEQKRQTLYERFEYNRAQRNQATRLLAAPNSNNLNAAPSAAETKITGELDASNRS